MPGFAVRFRRHRLGAPALWTSRRRTVCCRRRADKSSGPNIDRRVQAASTPTAFSATRCPACGSDELRRSRWQREDGLLRLLFFAVYRCRDCHRRFFRFSGRLFAAAAVVLALVLVAVGSGWLLREFVGLPPGQVEAPPPEPPIASPVQDTAIEPFGNLGLADLAEQGEARAQFSLGMSYLNGQGVNKDLGLARKWFERAAEHGFAEAQYALGAMYLSGRGALQDFQTAFQWFEKAARQNHAEAQFRLGAMYRSGHGVAADKTKAYVWFNLAAAQGHERAAESRDSLLRTLTSEQIAQGQRESQAWKPEAAKK
jgi:hypothetical protein